MSRIEQYKLLPRWKQRWISHLYELKKIVRQCTSPSLEEIDLGKILNTVKTSYSKLTQDIRQVTDFPSELSVDLETCDALQLLMTCILEDYDKLNKLDDLDKTHMNHVLEEIRPIYQKLMT